MARSGRVPSVCVVEMVLRLARQQYPAALPQVVSYLPQVVKAEVNCMNPVVDGGRKATVPCMNDVT